MLRDSKVDTYTQVHAYKNYTTMRYEQDLHWSSVIVYNRFCLTSVFLEPNEKIREVKGLKPWRRTLVQQRQQMRFSKVRARTCDRRSTTAWRRRKNHHGITMLRALSHGRITTTRTISYHNNDTRAARSGARRCEARGRCDSSGLSRTENVGKT